MTRSLPPPLLRKGFIAALVYAGGLAFLYVMQEQMLFPATVLPADYRFRFPQPFEELRIPAPGAVTSPMMLLHGRADALIPASDSVELRSLAHAPVELVLVDGAGHNDIHQFSAYLDALAARLAQLAPRGQSP
jgi:fermentation-respiration switch protein FrsA (DUF1100 family)